MTKNRIVDFFDNYLSDRLIVFSGQFLDITFMLSVIYDIAAMNDQCIRSRTWHHPGTFTALRIGMATGVCSFFDWSRASIQMQGELFHNLLMLNCSRPIAVDHFCL